MPPCAISSPPKARWYWTSAEYPHSPRWIPPVTIAEPLLPLRGSACTRWQVGFVVTMRFQFEVAAAVVAALGRSIASRTRPRPAVPRPTGLGPAARALLLVPSGANGACSVSSLSITGPVGHPQAAFRCGKVPRTPPRSSLRSLGQSRSRPRRAEFWIGAERPDP